MLRPTLGDFSSIVCFKAAITGMEEALGEKATAIALTAAGRYRGKSLAQELNIINSSMSLEELADKLDHVFGKDGTCLCMVKKIFQEDDGVIKVYTSETLCSAGEPQNSKRKCTYTLGAIWGVLELTLNQRLQGKHTESVLRGGEYDVFEFTKMS
jgi:predicted hydrocarbon binding protein